MNNGLKEFRSDFHRVDARSSVIENVRFISAMSSQSQELKSLKGELTRAVKLEKDFKAMEKDLDLLEND